MFQVLLHRYTDSDDIAVGSPSANRRQPETYDMIGLFINTLVMRNDLSGDPTFREFLARVQQTAIEAYDHEEMRFERLAKELHPEHDLTKQPLVQVLFSFHQRTSSQRVERRRDLAVGFEDVNLSLEGAEVFDLSLAISDAEQGFQAQFEYDESLFEHQTIVNMAAHFETLLEAMAADPDQRLSQLPLLSPHDREQLLVEWNRAPVRIAGGGLRAPVVRGPGRREARGRGVAMRHGDDELRATEQPGPTAWPTTCASAAWGRKCWWAFAWSLQWRWPRRSWAC